MSADGLGGVGDGQGSKWWPIVLQIGPALPAHRAWCECHSDVLGRV